MPADPRKKEAAAELQGKRIRPCSSPSKSRNLVYYYNTWWKIYKLLINNHKKNKIKSKNNKNKSQKIINNKSQKINHKK
jgi:hypothetical protein